nr:leucine--tRNA ligase, cytoplasmic-like [Tanacetum cinerariifolium]
MSETNTTKNRPAFRNVRRREELLEMEQEVRRWWDESRVFKSDVKGQPSKTGEKFFGNFLVPYTNGFLYLGHAFSLSKLKLASSFHRIRGVNVLLPFGFHCTGMPIKASTDKLQREKEKFGYPLCFPSKKKTSDTNPTPDKTSYYLGKFKGKKSKATAKTGKETYQWKIMRGYGLTNEEIATFQDPMKKLKEYEKIEKAFRYTIYSPLDGQPCADHDRASGEGVVPQEYTLIKMEVVPPFTDKFVVLQGKKVYLDAATLRPETMYGQTNAWVLPDGKYGAFEINEWEVFVMTECAARNLSYQHLSRVPKKLTCLVELTGQDLIGPPLRSPLHLMKLYIVFQCFRFSLTRVLGLLPVFLVIPLMISSHCSEPEKKVISRSGNECVVALTDQCAWEIVHDQNLGKVANMNTKRIGGDFVGDCMDATTKGRKTTLYRTLWDCWNATQREKRKINNASLIKSMIPKGKRLANFRGNGLWIAT